MTKEECEIETSKATMEMRNQIAELEKENAELKEIKELFSRLNKEQSEAILELKMQIEEMKSSSKHWEEAEQFISGVLNLRR